MSTSVRPPMPPAPPFTPPPQPPHARRLKAWQGVLIVVGGVLYWGLAVSLITALAVPTQAPTTQAPTTQAPATQAPTTQAPATQAPTSVPTPQPTATPKPAPTATPNPNASAPTYVAAIMPQVGSLTAAFDQAGTDCSAGDVTACRSGMQSVHDEVASFQAVLDQHPAPPCLKQADTLLRQALTDYHDAAELAVRGIDTGSSADLQSAGVLLDQGVTHISDATAALKQASC